MADDEPKKSPSSRQKLAALILGGLSTLAGLAVDTLTTWRNNVERAQHELERRVERLESLHLAGSDAPDTTETPR